MYISLKPSEAETFCKNYVSRHDDVKERLKSAHTCDEEGEIPAELYFLYEWESLSGVVTDLMLDFIQFEEFDRYNEIYCEERYLIGSTDASAKDVMNFAVLYLPDDFDFEHRLVEDPREEETFWAYAYTKVVGDTCECNLFSDGTDALHLMCRDIMDWMRKYGQFKYADMSYDEMLKCIDHKRVDNPNRTLRIACPYTSNLSGFDIKKAEPSVFEAKAMIDGNPVFVHFSVERKVVKEQLLRSEQ